MMYISRLWDALYNLCKLIFFWDAFGKKPLAQPVVFFVLKGLVA